MNSRNTRSAFRKILGVTSIVAPLWVAAPMNAARGDEVSIPLGTDVRAQHSDEPISIAEFDRLQREVRAPSDEVWRSIPWKTSILAAVAEARQVGKPVLLITTNGHLLGCG